MANTVDNRVVEMDFDNQQFEQGVQTSINSLGNLKKSLRFEEGSKSLAALSSAARNFSLDGVGQSVDVIANRFSALGVIGFTVLQNLTNSAIRLGQQLANAVVINPLRQGFAEYEVQMNAIQTILSNTAKEGTNLRQVNEALNQLNLYADKTIYNFTEMARNIGTFTAAGIKLDTSVAAIKGIANLAAVSGSNAQQASVAMYQLSQAMAAGTVRLMDWNSVVNAGMGGQVFQDALKETARVHNIKIDEMIKKEGSFRETLQKGWLTTEILTETLSKFTGDLTSEQLAALGYTDEQIASIQKLGTMANDAATKVKTFSQLTSTLAEAMQSGWAQTWQVIIGDFDEAKSLMTEISDILGGMISASAENRLALLKGWKDLGGRTALIDSVRNAFEGVLSIVKPMKEAFTEIFPPVTAKQLFNLSIGLKELTAKLKIGGEAADKIKRAFKGVASVFDVIRMAVISLGGGFASLLENVLPSGDSVLDFAANLGDSLVRFRDWVKTNDIFNRSIAQIGVVLTKAKNELMMFLNGAKIIYSWLENVFILMRDKLSNVFKDVDTTGVSSFMEKLQKRFSPLTTIASFVKKAVVGIGKILEQLFPFFMSLGTYAAKGLAALGKSLFEGMQNINYKNIFDSLNGGLIAALLISVNKFITRGTNILGNVSNILSSVGSALKSWQDNLKAKTLMNIAIALGILTVSIIALSMVDSAKLTAALVSMSAMFGELISAMAIVSKLPASKSFAGVEKATFAMIGLSAAVLLLSIAVNNLAKLDTKQLIKGVAAVQSISLTLIAFSYGLSENSGKMAKGASGLILYSAALMILVKVIEQLGNLKVDVLRQGLLAVGALTVEMGLFLKATNSSGIGVSKGSSLILLAGAIMVLELAVERFAKLDSQKLIQGLAGVGFILAELGSFVNLTGNSRQIIATSTGLLILGAAMLIFGDAVGKMGSMPLETIGKGLGTIAATLFIVGAALKIMPKNMIITGVGLLAVSGALVILSNAVSTLGGMTWEGIAKGLVGLAGSLLIISVALNAMNGALPGAAAMLVISAALAIFVPSLIALGKMSFQEIGRGLLALAAAFAILGVAGLVLAPLLPTLSALAGTMALFGLACMGVGVGVLLFSSGLAALAVSGTAAAAAIVIIITSIIGLIPMIISQLGGVISALADLIITVAPSVVEAFTVLLLSLITAIAAVTPPLLATLGALLLNLIALMVSVVPQFVSAALTILVSILQAFASKLPDIIQAGFDILIGFLKGIRDNIREVVVVTGEIIVQFIEGIAEELPKVIQAGVDLVMAFINGVADAIRNNKQELIDAAKNLADAIIDGLVTGLVGGAAKIGETMKNLGKLALDALKKALGIASPSRETMIVGKYMVEGLINGLREYGVRASTAAEDLAKKVLGNMSGVADEVASMISGEWDINPTIKPVIDMSNIMAEKRNIDDYFSGKKIGMSLNTGKLLAIAPVSPGNNPEVMEANATTSQASIVFNQNNYSPTALSRLEIYRQTKNQLALIKGLVGNQ